MLREGKARRERGERVGAKLRNTVSGYVDSLLPIHFYGIPAYEVQELAMAIFVRALCQTETTFQC